MADLTRGRVLVAHNAQFGYKFLHAETERALIGLPTTHRLCTVALSRRLDLPVANHKLATVAAYWGVPQYAAHDARDDVRVLREVFLHSQALAVLLGVAMPVLSCSGRGAVVYPAAITRVPSPYVNPKTWTPPARLVQGMKIVISGPAQRARFDFAQDLSQRGFDVMNSVSSQTRLLVCNQDGYVSGKADKARMLGVPVMSEAAVVALLGDIETGVLRGQSVSVKARSDGAPSGSSSSRVADANAVIGPWVGRTVLIVGGTAAEAAEARERAGALGARGLINLGARTTHALLLAGGEHDKRIGKIHERAIPLLTMADLDPAIASASAAQSAATAGQVPASADHGGSRDEGQSVSVLGRGHVMDLSAAASRFGLAASWEGFDDSRPQRTWEIDVVALALVADGRVEREEDLVFYNQPSTPDGSIRLTVDGDSEQSVEIDLEALTDETVRVRIAAAIDGEATFGEVGAIRLSLSDSDTGREIASAILDAATEERCLVMAELYRRHDAWRFRVVGQGYAHGLAELLINHGIDVG